MKKVELTLTQINYLIEESYNAGSRAQYSANRYLRPECIPQDMLDKLKAVKEKLYSEFKFDQVKETPSLEEVLSEAAADAIVKIKTFVDANKGNYSPFTIEDVFDEDTDQFVDPDFLEDAFEFIGDTQYDTNETMYMLGILWVGNDVQITAVSELGVEASFLVSDLPIETKCALADYLTSLV